MQVQALVESINRDRDRRMLIERQLQDAEHSSSESVVIPTSSPPNASAPRTASTEDTVLEQLAAARKELSALELRLKPDHPDLQRMYRVVDELEAKAAKAEARDAVPSAIPSIGPPRGTGPGKRAFDLRADLDQLDRQLASKQAEEERLRALAAGYQQRVEHAPRRESELTELTRDYSTLQSMYGALLAKQEESKIAADLERRQVSEQFKVLDPAQMAEQPFSPNRRRLVMIGVAGGLALGLGLVALVEYRDRSFKTDLEVVKQLTLPVLAVVPFMESDIERHKASRRRTLIGCGLGGMIAACFALVAFTFLG